jgi:hypothetical protein
MAFDAIFSPSYTEGGQVTTRLKCPLKPVVMVHRAAAGSRTRYMTRHKIVHIFETTIDASDRKPPSPLSIRVSARSCLINH